MHSHSLRTLRGQLLREVITLLLFASLMLQSATAVAPDWWSTRSALLPDADSDDFAVANLGQLKNLAQKAVQEMNDSFPGGAGTALNAMIDTWTAPPATGVSRDDYAALTLGQLKAIAKPFYDRLAAVGVRDAGAYPWTGTHADDYSLANLGQVKTVFAFPVPPLVQLATQTGIPSAQLLAAVQAWQNIAMDQRAEDATLDDLDGDGISNLQEYLMGTPLFDPADIDGDRIPNTVEDLYPGILSKSRFADAVEDYDGDGVMNYEEIQLGLSLSAPTSGRTDGLSDAQVLATHLKQTLPGTVREMAQRQLWDFSILFLTEYNEDDGLLTGHPEWQSQEDANTNGLPDGWEAYIAAYVPPVTRATYTDCDGDHMPDTWEYRYQLDLRDAGDAGSDLFYSVTVPQAPVAPNPADYSPEDYAVAFAQYQSALAYYTPQYAFMVQTDPDLDHLCNLREYYLGSNPRLADTNGDGTADETAVLAGNDPSGGGANLGAGALADDDGDGIPNLWEFQHNLDPEDSNSGQDYDKDGYTDYEEYTAGTDMFSNSSRPGPSLEVRQKSYGCTFTHSTPYPGVVWNQFEGEARQDGGKTYLYVSGFNGSYPIINSDDRTSEMQQAFFGGDYEGALTTSLFNSESQYAWSLTNTFGDTDGPNWYKTSGANAMELRITDSTIPSASAIDWTRSYLVVQYSGAVADYPSFNHLPLTNILGSLTFSRTAQGVKSINFQGESAGQVKITGDRVEIIPLQQDNAVAFKIALFPLEICVPDVPAEKFKESKPYSYDGTPFTETGNSAPPTPPSSGGVSNPEIVNKGFKAADELKIALFKYSLNHDVPPVINFLKEPDSFIARIKGPGLQALSGTTIEIQTFDSAGEPDGEEGKPDRGPHTLALTWFAASPGYPEGLYSPAMILVSDEVDRSSAKALNSNNAPISIPDQVFKVKGGGNLAINSVRLPNKSAKTIDVKIPAVKIVREIPVTFYVLDNADDKYSVEETPKEDDPTNKHGADAMSRAKTDVIVANERLLQFGIKISPSFNMLPTPDWLKARRQTKFKDLQQYARIIDISSAPSVYTEDQKNLAKLTKKNAETDVIVLYTGLLDDTPDSYDPRYDTIRGFTIKQPSKEEKYKDEDDKKFKQSMSNRIYISFHLESEFTLAHEFVHYLTQKNHFMINGRSDYLDPDMKDDNNVWAQRNLMKFPTSENIFTGTKRLSRYQEHLIYSEGALKVK